MRAAAAGVLPTVNPSGKVPALSGAHRAVVTERVAICLHLADAFPRAGLAPAGRDPLRWPYPRGPNLRSMVCQVTAFEPAAIDRAMERGPPQPGMSPGLSHHGTHEGTPAVTRGMLAPGPLVLGERFPAADILRVTAIEKTMTPGMVPQEALLEGFVALIVTRPAMRRARRRDAILAADRG